MNKRDLEYEGQDNLKAKQAQEANTMQTKEQFNYWRDNLAPTSQGQQAEHTPTPGAVRAAKRIWETYLPSREETERIIDEETHGRELLAALKSLVDGSNIGIDLDEIKKARAVIAAATSQE